MSKIKNGDFVQLHYTGTLEDDSVFDSSDCLLYTSPSPRDS